MLVVLLCSVRFTSGTIDKWLKYFVKRDSTIKRNRPLLRKRTSPAAHAPAPPIAPRHHARHTRWVPTWHKAALPPSASPYRLVSLSSPWRVFSFSRSFAPPSAGGRCGTSTFCATFVPGPALVSTTRIIRISLCTITSCTSPPTTTSTTRGRTPRRPMATAGSTG